MSLNDMNGGEPAKPGTKSSGLFWMAVLCLILLGGLGVGYATGYGPAFLNKAPAPELSSATSEWRPRKPIELVVMAGEGGGADRLARFVQSIIEINRFSDQPIVVVNKGGDSGGDAMRYLMDKAGDPHVLMMTLNSIYTTPLRRPELGVRIEDFTPIARLAADTFVLGVNAESKIRTVEDYWAAVRAAGPKTWKMGGTGTGQEDSQVTAMMEAAYSIKHSYVPYKGGGKVAKSLIEGEIQSTVNNPSEQMSYYKAGKSRPIAAFTTRRIPALPDVPTFRELGHDLVYSMQRSIVAPPNILPAAQAYYQGLFHRVYLSAEWENYAEEKSLVRAFLPGRPLMAYFIDERNRHRELLSSMGEAF